MYFVYILENRPDRSWYTGFTSDIKRRLRQHLSGCSPYTSKKNNWRLIYCEIYLDKQDAIGREKFLKSGAGKKFIKKQLFHYLKSNS
ncbi:GIY-YIG nuclease family protein [Patescibacteria group bacterium]|nr:GIY-YIG nuclease family protein [Patescibacteria group bacterium]